MAEPCCWLYTSLASYVTAMHLAALLPILLPPWGASTIFSQVRGHPAAGGGGRGGGLHLQPAHQSASPQRRRRV